MILDKLVQKIGYTTYNRYLNSTHWKAVKVRLLKSKLVRRDDKGMPVCEACGSDKKLHVHHRTYKTLGKERVMDLALVCELCHMYIHKYATDRGINLWSATKKAIKELKKTIKTAPREINLKKKLNKEAAQVSVNFGTCIDLRKHG